MEKIDHNAHSVYLMYYHLIMVVKYRRKVIDNPISERAKEIWEHIAPRYGIVLEEWNHDIDHVHVMFRAQPRTELSKFINAYKSASSRLLGVSGNQGKTLERSLLESELLPVDSWRRPSRSNPSIH